MENDDQESSTHENPRSESYKQKGGHMPGDRNGFGMFPIKKRRMECLKLPVEQGKNFRLYSNDKHRKEETQ